VIAADESWWHAVWRWTEEQAALLGWLFVGSIASLVLCALLLPVIVVRLPADYFASSREHRPQHRTVLAWLWRVVKNVLGLLFLLAGIAMLVLPGQGLLTILIGLLLLEFPGKRELERRLVARPKILALLNRMRRRRGHADLIVD